MIPITRSALKILAVVVLVAATGGAAQCQADTKPAASDSQAASASTTRVVFAPATASDEQQQRLMLASAKTAWNYVQRNYSSSTGLVRALDAWEWVTIWDIASALAAYHSAYGLKLITEQDYRKRVDRALATLETMPLYEGVAFNKTYSARSGEMVGRDQKGSARGYGWSVLDMGRFLVWMKIIAETDPVARPAVERIIQRLALTRMIRKGYLLGGGTDAKYEKHHEYQEGRIGYEQYAAYGFSVWGARADSAISFATNAKPLDVLGLRVLGDRRGGENLTSEPYIMMGLEAGWPSAEWEDQARNVLGAQQERFKRTGIVTMVSEDAVPIKPRYFYYYVLQRDGKDFVVRAASGDVNPTYPRWVSAKAAFGWHALFPSDYTWTAIQTVRAAGASGKGWSAGVFERSKRATPSFNLNTAALVLESAYHFQRKCALIKPSCS